LDWSTQAAQVRILSELWLASITAWGLAGPTTDRPAISVFCRRPLAQNVSLIGSRRFEPRYFATTAQSRVDRRLWYDNAGCLPHRSYTRCLVCGGVFKNTAVVWHHLSAVILCASSRPPVADLLGVVIGGANPLGVPFHEFNDCIPLRQYRTASRPAQAGRIWSGVSILSIST
jgi:hypothetical protein